MITTFIVIFCGSVYLLGWLVVMVLETMVRIITNLFKRLFKIGAKNESEPVVDDIVEIQTIEDDKWGHYNDCYNSTHANFPGHRYLAYVLYYSWLVWAS